MNLVSPFLVLEWDSYRIIDLDGFGVSVMLIITDDFYNLINEYSILMSLASYALLYKQDLSQEFQASFLLWNLLLYASISKIASTSTSMTTFLPPLLLLGVYGLDFRRAPLYQYRMASNVFPLHLSRSLKVIITINEANKPKAFAFFCAFFLALKR